MRDQRAVSTVIGAILVFAVLSIFFMTFVVKSVPVWVKQSEAAHGADLRRAFLAWGEALEDQMSRDLIGRPFAHTVPVGNDGLVFVSAGSSFGRVGLETGPTLQVSVNGATLFSSAGTLSAATGYTRLPPLNYRFLFGALELQQGPDAWVDLRAFLRAERYVGGTLLVSLQAVSLAGPPHSATSGGDVQVLAALSEASDVLPAAGTVRILLDGVAAPSWRASLERGFHEFSLTGQSLADCSTATANYCFDTDTNDSNTVDLYLRNVATGWSARFAVAQVQVGA